MYRQRRAGVVFLDVRLPDCSGLDLLEQLRGHDPSARVVVITAYGTLDVVMRAVGAKAYDYLIKPLDLDRAAALAQRAASDQPASPPPAQAEGEPRLVGTSPAMQQVYRQIAMAAQSDVSVLITGATGTGKELVARAVHDYSRRKDGPFVPVNCGALPETLVESELFGHVRGAFTGADADRAGRFEAARGGTILLDEIGDLPLAAQVKLLRVLDTRLVERLGSTRSIELDVRVLAATNRDLRAETAAGRFRADLFYRLAVTEISLPPLAQRRQDILPLAQALLRRCAAGRTAMRLSDEAAEIMLRHDWPGNVRELRNAIEHAAVLAGDGPILPEHLPRLAGQAGKGGEGLAGMLRSYLASLPAGADLSAVMSMTERELIRHALGECGGNQSQAAERLGVHRNTLRNRLRELGLESPEA
jgi:DNA-binding NtrC family response regulator